ncbi:isochorismatase family protein [Maricaulis sp.]|uniref:isochorismatase family protein n=1 Tax=Maricaulis sp. TaxID=1486257 RepID=UPI003A907568
MSRFLPTLVLLDCQRESLDPGEAEDDGSNAAVADRIRRLLTSARLSGWNILHCQYKSNRPAINCGVSVPGAPIDGLAPLSREAVFIRTGLSAYSDPDFGRMIRHYAGPPCFLVGFSAPFSLMATMFDAVARDQRLTVIPEAVGGRAVGPRSASSVRDISFDLIDRLSSTVLLDEVVATWLRSPETPTLKKIGIG